RGEGALLSALGPGQGAAWIVGAHRYRGRMLGLSFTGFGVFHRQEAIVTSFEEHADDLVYHELKLTCDGMQWDVSELQHRRAPGAARPGWSWPTRRAAGSASRATGGCARCSSRSGASPRWPTPPGVSSPAAPRAVSSSGGRPSATSSRSTCGAAA